MKIHGAAWVMVLAGLTFAGLSSGAAASTAASHRARADFYVSTSGNDSWSGTLAAPNARHTDGPFATVSRAQAAVRSLRSKPGRAAKPVHVMIRAGVYYLKKPLVFTPDDSGAPGAPIVYEAYSGEKPVISGGRRLGGWKVGLNGWWTYAIPDVKDGKWSFSQLFVNGHRRYRPRLPESGYYHIADSLPPSARAEGKGFDRFQFAEADINPAWHDLRDVEVLCFQSWTMAQMRIADVDEANRTVTFTGHTAGANSFFDLPKGGRYLVENVREAMSREGQCYLDRKTGALSYIPMANENPASSTVIAPYLQHVVEIKGNMQARRFVHGIIFRGLTFAHTNWITPPEGDNFPQAEAGLGAAVTAVGARMCALEDCTVTHTGEYAVQWGAGCQHDRVEGCRLTDLGAGGVKIGTMGAAEDPEALTSHITVANCLIAHAGRLHPGGVGVWIGQSPYNTVRNNDIHDLYYTGVSVGWTWGYGPSEANHNVIGHNLIYQIGQGVLSDMGGIYTLGLSPGTVLRGNVIHDVTSFSYGGWGIYFDEGTSGVLAEDNIVYRCKSAGFHQHYGQNNRVVNNIFALGTEAQIQRTRPEDHLSFTFQHNIVYWQQGTLYTGNLSDNHFAFDDNLYWDASGRPVTFDGMTLAEWQAKGQDEHSIIADPLFVNPAKGVFRLMPGSPALKVGFRPIDVRAAGPRVRLGDEAEPPAYQNQ